MLKIKNSVYMAFAGLLFLVLNDLDVVNITNEKYDQYVSLIAIVLAGIGVLVNPQEEQQEEIFIDVNKDEDINP